MVMEQESNKLEYVHITQPTQEILQYIDNRRKGVVKSLKTRWHKFNRQCMGGIEPNTIYSVCGISGSGKSSFANSLETDLFEMNPNEDFVVLSFNFEMLASKQVGRKLSYRLKKTTSELYSGLDDERANLNDSDYEQVIQQAEKIKYYPVYYVDRPGNVDEIRSTIIDFYKNVAKGRWMVIIIDHTLLIKDKRGESERRIISDMQRIFMELKKFGKTSIIQLSQMNREIEDKDRISNNLLHYPVRRDIAASDSVFQVSDIVIVLHRPELLGIRKYGPSKLPVDNLIYMHFLKAREGEPTILVFENNLKHNSIEETTLYN
jgi:replicative DNA helicase